MKKIFLSICLSMIAFSTFAKDGYKVNATILNNTDSMVYLCYYFGNGSTVQKIDSARLTQGTTKFTMSGKQKITSGIYMFLFADKSPQVELILENGSDLVCEFDKTDFTKTMKFSNDVANKRFYDDKVFLADINPRVAEISKKLESGKKKDTTYVNEQYELINKSIFKFRDDLIAADPKSVLAVLYTGMKEPIIPDAIIKMKDGKMKDSLKFVYYKNNFWNDWNFNDDRLVYAPILDGKLTSYFRLVPSTPDSFNVEADRIMKKLKCNTDMYKYCFWWMTRYAGVSKVMGMDESYVYMIEKYIMSRDYCGHLDSATKAAYITDAQKMGKSIMGMIGQDIQLPDDKEVMQTLLKTCAKGDYTVLCFFDPTCHHCEQEVPSMDSLLNIVEKEQNIKIMRYAVQNADEDEKWHKFIKDKKLNNNWVHVHNPTRVGSYRVDYNVISNPVFYLMGKDGEILGKRIDHTNIGGLLKHLVGQEKNKIKH
jgi:Domain of unknown function (DUF5106)/Thioredoxin-like/Domain of unknown function (DUF4369)